MTGNRSQNAARYGALAERVGFERYGLEADRDGWHDARDDDGDPWDVKACMKVRASGAPGRFRLWREQHQRLAREGGGYVFVLYSAVGRGIRVHKTRSVRAQNLRLTFYGAGDHPKGKQLKVPPERVFSG